MRRMRIGPPAAAQSRRRAQRAGQHAPRQRASSATSCKSSAPEDFYSSPTRRSIEAIIDLYDRASPSIWSLLADYLNDKKQLEDVGGYAYLAELWDAAPSAANAEYYAEIVREKAIVRNLIHACTESAARRLRPGAAGRRAARAGRAPHPRDRRDGHHRRHHTRCTRPSTRPTTASTPASNAGRHRISAASRPAISTSTADGRLAELRTDHRRRPAVSVGKTSFALKWSATSWSRRRLPVFFVSLEQSRIELAERLLCCQARVDSHKLAQGPSLDATTCRS